MRRVIIQEFDKLAELLSNLNAMFGFRLQNICVKANEAALIPVMVEIEGEEQPLEKCTTISKKDDYNFMVIPNYQEDIPAIQEGFLDAHPEFKQKIEQLTIELSQPDGTTKEKDIDYLLLTMPEVDDDRYDVIKDAVKLAYDDCKQAMERANANADAKFAEYAAGETKENMDLLKVERDKLNKQWNDAREGTYKNKLDEIEEAHNKWLTQKQVHEQQKAEEDAARGEEVTRSMRMTNDDE